VANKTRYLPLHTMAERWAESFCNVVIAAHHQTRCDATSKFGTKAAGVKNYLIQYLSDFGKDLTNIDVAKSETYLVKVYKCDSECASMDEPRYHLYHHSKKTILNLPATSRAVQGHIMKALYGSFLQMHCFEDLHSDPSEFGNHKDGKMLVPDENLLLYQMTSQIHVNAHLALQNDALLEGWSK